METLPKDVVRLLLTNYLSADDAVKCYLHVRLFHDACNVFTLGLIKKKYYSNKVYIVATVFVSII